MGRSLSCALAAAAIWLLPRPSAAQEDQVGLASWYGPEHRGKATASGEPFDMNALTAAHRTLPMQALVQVTNMRSGRSLLVRINDRGPFMPGRIIDLSAHAAQLLGFRKAGLARVRLAVVATNTKR